VHLPVTLSYALPFPSRSRTPNPLGLCYLPLVFTLCTFWFLPFWVFTQKGKNQSFAGKGPFGFLPKRVKTKR
jgi:hypothetical protein